MLFHMWTWWKAFQYLEAARKNRMFDCSITFGLETSPGFSIVLPTLWPYLREMNVNTQFLAAVVAAYSVGEGCGGTNGSNPNDCTSTIAHG